MKKSILLFSFLSLLTVGSALCQNVSDTFPNEANIMTNKKARKFPIYNISLSYIGWQGLPSNVKYQPNNNRQFSAIRIFNILKESKHFNFGPGLSMSVMNLHDNVSKWQFDSSGKVSSSQILPDTFDKHKLTLSYIYIPLEVRYRFGSMDKRQPFLLGFGVKAGMLLYASERSKFGNFKVREKIKDGISNISYGMYTYFGYKFVGIIAGYNLSPVFDSDHSPSVTSWTAGLYLKL